MNSVEWKKNHLNFSTLCVILQSLSFRCFYGQHCCGLWSWSFAMIIGLHGHRILYRIVGMSRWIWSVLWRLESWCEQWMLRWLVRRYLNGGDRCCWRCRIIIFEMIRQMIFVVWHVVQWLMMFYGVCVWWMSWGDKIIVRLSIEWM